MNFLSELCESKLFTSKTAYRKYTGRQLAEMLYINILAYAILSTEETSFVKEYARKTKYHNSFDSWYTTNVTDLYLLIHGIESDETQYTHDNKAYLEKLHFDNAKFLSWMKSIYSGNDTSELYASRFLITIEKQLKVDNSTYRSLRRLVSNWTDLNKFEKKIAVTKTKDLLHRKCPYSDLLPELEKFIKHHDLNVSEDTDHDKILSKIASKHNKLEEDGEGGGPATAITSADIAPMVTPLFKKPIRRSK